MGLGRYGTFRSPDTPGGRAVRHSRFGLMGNGPYSALFDDASANPDRLARLRLEKQLAKERAQSSELAEELRKMKKHIAGLLEDFRKLKEDSEREMQSLSKKEETSAAANAGIRMENDRLLAEVDRRMGGLEARQGDLRKEQEEKIERLSFENGRLEQRQSELVRQIASLEKELKEKMEEIRGAVLRPAGPKPGTVPEQGSSLCIAEVFTSPGDGSGGLHGEPTVSRQGVLKRSLKERFLAWWLEPIATFSFGNPPNE